MQHKDFEVVKVIGRGAFGEVQLVRHFYYTHIYIMILGSMILLKNPSNSSLKK
jgi:protein-S-isoprenylcysteine O-methyltransferase Ste14